MKEENKKQNLKTEQKKWPLNSEGPQNYSSNGRVKTLQMYSFYKNTLILNCCFSNVSLLHLVERMRLSTFPSWGDLGEAHQGSRKILGRQPLCSNPTPPSSFIIFGFWATPEVLRDSSWLGLGTIWGVGHRTLVSCMHD